MSADLVGVLVGQLVVAVIGLIVAVAGYVKMKTRTEEARQEAQEARRVGESTYAQVKEVKQKVDGQHTALLEKLGHLRTALAEERAKNKDV